MTITGQATHTSKVRALALAHSKLDLSKVRGLQQRCIETKVCLMGVFWHATVTCHYDNKSTVMH